MQASGMPGETLNKAVDFRSHPLNSPRLRNEQAHAWASMGFYVFPSYGFGTKVPAVKWKAAATGDHKQIDEWWPIASTYPPCNVCYTLGRAHGFNCVLFDIDVKTGKNGVDEFLEAAGNQFALYETKVIRTPSGGFHVLYRTAAGGELFTNSSGLRDVDVRGQGGYALAPGSFIEGVNAWYEPWGPESSIQPLRSELLAVLKPYRVISPEELAAFKKTPDGAGLNGSGENYLRAMQYLAEIGPTVEFNRADEKLFKICCHIVCDLDIPPHIALPLLRTWNAGNPKPWPDEVLLKKLEGAEKYATFEPGNGLWGPKFEKYAPDVEPVTNDEPKQEQAKEQPHDQSTKKPAAQAHSPYGFEVLKGDAFKRKPVKWLWPKVLVAGSLNLIAGFPENGKSTCAFNIAAAITVGRAWPCGMGYAPRGRVMIISSEDQAETTIGPKMDAAGADPAMWEILKAVRKPAIDKRGKPIVDASGAQLTQRLALDLSADLGYLQAYLGANPDIRLVIIDPLSAYWGESKSEKSGVEAVMRSVMTPFVEIAARFDVAILGIAHVNKGKHERAMEKIAGSLSVVAQSRSAWWLCADPEDENRMLFLPIKTNLVKRSERKSFSFTFGEKFYLNEDDPTDPICGSFITWNDQFNTKTADEMLRAQSDDGRRASPALENAKTFLWFFLLDGPKRVGDVRMAAAIQQPRVSKNTLYDARTEMGVISMVDHSDPTGKSALWALPQETRE